MTEAPINVAELLVDKLTVSAVVVGLPKPVIDFIEQRAAVACRDFAFFDPFEERRFERKQADGICNGGPVLSSPGRHFVLGKVKFLHEPVKSAGLFDGI